MYEILKKITQFTLAPQNKVEENITFKKKIKNIIVIYLLNFFITLIIAILIKFVFEIESVNLNKIKNEWTLIKVFFVAVLLVPICEEIIFRLSLIFKPSYIALSSFIFSFIAFSSFYYHIAFFNFEKNIFVRLIFSVTVSLILYLASIKYFNVINCFWKNNFRYIFYLSISLFGIFHIGNYEFSYDKILIFPLLILPQLISGSLLGYIRISYGFLYACFFHILLNLVPFMI